MHAILDDFLQQTLAMNAPRGLLYESDTLSVHGLGLGLVGFYAAGSKAHPLIISCGIHGNETAPIEMCNRLLQAINRGGIAVNRHVLFVFGNIKAMLAKQRFVDENLNRLFGVVRTHSNIEADRANVLEQTIADFLDGCQQRGLSTSPWHYDFHTAIRDSEIPRFALYPYVEHRLCPDQQLSILSEMGVQAWVQQHREGHTFASYTGQQYDAQSFTVELGKVRPFNENRFEEYRACYQTLAQLIENQPLPDQPRQPLRRFQVVHELVKTSLEFELTVDEDCKNFTTFEQGHVIARDGDDVYRVKHPQERLIFPNNNVRVGQRAGLMIVEND